MMDNDERRDAPRAPEPTPPDDLQREIESAIRPRTGCWPSTVEVVAAAIMDVLRQMGAFHDQRMPEPGELHRLRVENERLREKAHATFDNLTAISGRLGVAERKNERVRALCDQADECGSGETVELIHDIRAVLEGGDGNGDKAGGAD